MNEPLQNHLSDITDWIKSTAQSIEAMATEQIPLFIQEYLAWHFYSNFFWAIYGTIMFVSSIFVFKTFLKQSIKVDWNQPENSKEAIYIAETIISGVILFTFSLNFLCGSLGNAQEVIKVRVAPRVVMMEQVKQLIK